MMAGRIKIGINVFCAISSFFLIFWNSLYSLSFLVAVFVSASLIREYFFGVKYKTEYSMWSFASISASPSILLYSILMLELLDL
jgi:hypothetical protein